MPSEEISKAGGSLKSTNKFSHCAMDHARKIGKINTPILWSQKPSPPCNHTMYEGDGSLDEDLGEDRRLVNWRKWLKNREKHYRHYEQRCDRDREDLLMVKDLDDYRAEPTVEDIVDSVDRHSTGKDRGSPAFWVTPEFLSKRGHPDWPDIAVTLTHDQTNAKFMTERVALPDLIKREKGLPRSKERKKLRKTGYEETREKKVPGRIGVLARGERDLNQLAIKGEKFEGKTAKRVPRILVTSVETLRTLKSDDGSQSEVIEPDGAERPIALVIQDREVAPDKRISLSETDESGSNHLTWSLTFKSTDLSASKREIRLENRGNYAITYRWRYNIQNPSFLLPVPWKSPFFFNKNKGLILPGQIIELPVWFRSRLPRIASESWTLTTEPPVCQESLNFRFSGIATLSTRFEHSNVFKSASTDFTSCESIEKYLDRRTRDARIHQIITSIIDDVPRKDLPLVPYDSLFVESELFDAKNPMHFYHSELIRDLRNIHENLTSRDSPAWGLSLMELRRVLLMIKDPELRNEKLLRFNELCLESLKPSLLHGTRSDKGTVVYNLLCSFANKFEAESHYVAIKCSPVEISTARNFDEAPDDVSKPASMTSSQGSLITPRKKSRKKSRLGPSKTTSKTSVSTSTNNRDITGNAWDEKNAKSCFLLKEVFRVRIREILADTILAICAAVDTYNNLSPHK